MKITSKLIVCGLGMLLFTGEASVNHSNAAEVSGEPVALKVASFRVGSSWYVYGVTLGEMLRNKLPKGSTIDTPPLGGGTANPLLISSGRAQFGFGFSVANVWATKGTGFFKKPITNLRGLIGGLDQYYLGVVARGKLKENTLEKYVNNASGVRVILLKKGSFGSYSGQQLLSMVGAGEEELKARKGSYQFTDFGTIKAAFPTNRADLFIQVITRGHPAVMEMSQTADVTFLGLGEKMQAQFRKRFGWGEATLPAGTFRGQDKSIVLPATTTSMFASTDMSDETAYTIVKTVCENQDKFRAGHKALSNFDCAKTAWDEKLIGLTLHSGAARYYRERDWLK